MEISYDDYLEMIGEVPEFKGLIKGRISIRYDLYVDKNVGSDGLYIDNYEPDYIRVELGSNNILNELADDMRDEAGYIPCFRENDDGEQDEIGWYDYYLFFNSYTSCYTENVQLTFVPRASDQQDVDDEYEIPLTKQEQEAILEKMRPMIKEFHHVDVVKFMEGREDYGDDT